MLKRSVDLGLILLSAPLWLPLLALACLVSFAIGGLPVFFTQARGGIGGSVFKLYKLRTMTQARDVNGALLADELRLTAVGKIMRALSFDELPGIFNVIKGDMALVGPRPLIADYLPMYTERQARRHEVLPGITGWAQVNGRNSLSWESKFELDVWYVEHRSFWLDLKILGLTVKKVLVRDGISAKGEQTMPRFLGSEKK